MFDFGKRRRAEARKREAVEIGSQVVEQFNADLWRWRREDLETRRELMATAFEERVGSMEPPDGLTFSDAANLEALALLRNWDAAREGFAADAMLYQKDQTLEDLAVLGIGPQAAKTVERFIDEVSKSLEADIDRAIDEVLAKRTP